MIDIKIQPTDIQKLSPKITVIGVGGAGGNAVNNMISSNLEGCEFLVCNTDSQALAGSLADEDRKIQLGVEVTGGLGAGSKPEIGKAAAEESLGEVMQYLDGANMVFVTAGMGGGTGTGAAPVIARACREQGILTVGVVTKPFHFEGSHRMKAAEAGIKEMQEFVDTLIVIPNQNLFRVANEKTTFAESFQMADSVLQAGVRGVTDLMVRPGLVNLDFADIRTAMMEMGKAMMGTGEAEGEKRAIEAAEAAINNPLLDDVSMKGARGVIINVTGGYDMTLFEADEACNRIRDEVDPDANIIFGATFDDSLAGKMRVSIVATGIEKEVEDSKKTPESKSRTKMAGIGKVGLERAVPSAASSTAARTMARSETPSPAAMSSPPPATPASTPTFVPAARPDSAAAPASSSPSPSAAARTEQDPEQDMFEQSEFAQAGLGGRGITMPQNTALRGTRYNNAFIPPSPVKVSSPGSDSPVAGLRGGYTPEEKRQGGVPLSSTRTAPRGTFPQGDVAASGASGGLQLNPPRPAVPVKKRAQSLFERISDTVHERLEGIKSSDGFGHGGRESASSPQGRTAPPVSGGRVSSAPQSPQPQPSRQEGPSQGRLNIESPAQKSQKDDDLDIPAFLRRQAN